MALALYFSLILIVLTYKLFLNLLNIQMILLNLCFQLKATVNHTPLIPKNLGGNIKSY